MHANQHPSTRTLIVIWACLIAATIMTMVAGKVTEVTSIGLVWVGLLMLVTWVKAILIVSYFLNLKAATGNWQQVFTLLIGAIIVIIFVLYVLLSFASLA